MAQMSVSAPISIEEVKAASERIRPLVHRTPVLTSRLLDEAVAATCFLKCENFQRGGSFKMRGAANFVLSLSEEERKRGVVAFSSGNHAQAVAIAAEELHIPATIIMPSDAPKSKVESTRAHHARIIHYDRHREDREAIGRKIAEESGATVLPPYDHLWTIAGQATATLELLEETGPLDAIVVCLGGGGLLAGALIVAKSIHPHTRVFGAEPELGNDWAQSLKQGKRVKIESPDTIADGLRTVQPGEITFPIVQGLGDGVLLVSDNELAATLRFLLTRMKLVTEPSGCAAAAAVLHKKLPSDAQRIGIIVSGGNIDLPLLAKLCQD